MSEPSLVSYSTDGHVAIITLNRPEAMNAMNAKMRSEISDAQFQAEHDENVRIVVLTGSGNSFSAGTDLKEAASIEGEAFDNSITDYKPLVDGITKSQKIYIAAINGITGGVSLGFALGADLAVMSDQATIFSPFSNIGLVPDGGASWFMLQHLGHKRAFAAIAECTRLDPQTCLNAGMVNKVVPHDTLQDETLAWAKSLAERAPLSLRYTKQLLHAAATIPREDAARLESEYQNKCARSEDSKTGIMAFVTKQKATFKGR